MGARPRGKYLEEMPGGGFWGEVHRYDGALGAIFELVVDKTGGVSDRSEDMMTLSPGEADPCE